MHLAPCTWHLATPAGIAGAVAIIEIIGDLDHAFAALEIRPLGVGDVALRNLFDLDTALVTRVGERTLHLLPHGGTALVRALIAALEARGIAHAPFPSPRDLYPEATTDLEARMLHALAHAPSPRAIDLLLDQPRRRSAHLGANLPPVAPTHAAALAHLLTPPMVAILGPANIGKSTLLNALAGRDVAIVADVPGTTRDHVGVMLTLDGLTIRCIDTPGVRDLDAFPEHAIEREALLLALDLANKADFILLVADATAPFLWPNKPREPDPAPMQHLLRLGLRADLGPTPGADLCVSAHSGANLDALATLIRTTLVPDAALADPGAWSMAP